MKYNKLIIIFSTCYKSLAFCMLNLRILIQCSFQDVPITTEHKQCLAGFKISLPVIKLSPSLLLVFSQEQWIDFAWTEIECGEIKCISQVTSELRLAAKLLPIWAVMGKQQLWTYWWFQVLVTSVQWFQCKYKYCTLILVLVMEIQREFLAPKLGHSHLLCKNTVLVAAFPSWSATTVVVRLQQHHRVKFTYQH